VYEKYVNIAYQKTKGSCALEYQDAEYNMENLPDLLRKRFVEQKMDFDADFYWFIVELLSKNGYGYYVNVFHRHAIESESFGLGILGLVSFCRYDISVMCKPFIQKIFNMMRDTEYVTIIKMNLGVIFNCSFPEAEKELKRFQGLLDGFAEFEKMLAIVLGCIGADIQAEETHLNEQRETIGKDWLHDVYTNAYMREKKSYVSAISDEHMENVRWAKDYISNAVRYYANLRDNYQRIAADRITAAVSGGFIGKAESDMLSSKISELSPHRLDEIEGILYKSEKSSSPPEPTENKKLIKTIKAAKSRNTKKAPVKFETYAVGSNLAVSVSEAASGNPVVEIEGFSTGSRRTWWQQCGAAGQWIYTYSAVSGLVQKWEIREAEAESEGGYQVSRVWSDDIGSGRENLSACEEYLTVELDDGSFVIYPNDVRYTAYEKRHMLPEIFGFASPVLKRSLKKWRRR